MTIRQATPEDFDAIYSLVKTAFQTAKVSDGGEQDFVLKLRKGSYIPELELVAEEDGVLIGHIMLTGASIRENGGCFGTLLLAPLSVALEWRAKGIGAALIREALAKASVLDLIDSLPDGLDTQVGELGDRLSEGERQRIGLARVFLRNADLVLFDEPTSRLDALNEAIILRSIHELSKSEQNADKGQDVAVVLVSHRESAMRVADAVLNL